MTELKREILFAILEVPQMGDKFAEFRDIIKYEIWIHRPKGVIDYWERGPIHFITYREDINPLILDDMEDALDEIEALGVKVVRK